jgi:hypothetical protein
MSSIANGKNDLPMEKFPLNEHPMCMMLTLDPLVHIDAILLAWALTRESQKSWPV